MIILFLKQLYKQIFRMGIDLKMIYLFFKWLPSSIKEYFQLLRSKWKDKKFPIKNIFLINQDRYDLWWVAQGHYFHQDLLVAQMIYESKPMKHMDVWSRIDWFIAHVASYREIEIIDIRKIDSKSKNIIFRQLDMMEEIPTEYVESTDSLSCLHTIEHFGLWRYGDIIDYNGHIKWFEQMIRILKSGWVFYFSTPISNQQRIEFNAHRVFSIQYLIEYLFKDRFEIISFSYVDDKGDLYQNVILDERSIKSVFNLRYGCGIFELRKL